MSYRKQIFAAILMSGIASATSAYSGSFQEEFVIKPGNDHMFSFSKLYRAKYTLTCNVKDISNREEDYNAVRITAKKSKYLITIDNQYYSNVGEITFRTKPTGSVIKIENIYPQYYEELIIYNMDYNDELSFKCRYDLVNP
jgi:hypothetical protein